MPCPVTVVIATRDRCGEVLATLDRLAALPEQPPLILVDDGSRDGTAAAVERRGGCRVVRLAQPRGAAARTAGVREAGTPFAAFCDDDSWWTPGSLRLAADCLERHPRVALLAARVLVGREERLDPVCAAMAADPLGADPELPGPEVLGFLACAAVLRRDAYLQVGGFHPRYGIGGEEQLLALALRAAGWRSAYVEGVVAHHHPSPARDPLARRRRELRNDLWTAWLTRRPRAALRATGEVARRAPREREARGALLDTVRAAPWLWRERTPLPALVEDHAARVLDRA